MSFIEGFDRMLSCTTEFEATVAFVSDVLGLDITEPAVPLTDPHWSRCAVAVLRGNQTMAVVEPTRSAELLGGHQILCLNVRDIWEATRELERR